MALFKELEKKIFGLRYPKEKLRMLVNVKKFGFIIWRVFSVTVFLNLFVIRFVAWFAIGHVQMCEIVSLILWHLGQVELW